MNACRCALSALLAVLAVPAQDAPTMTIEGRVTGVCGDALRVAEVWVTAPDAPDDKPLRRTFADGEGVFRLGRVPQRAELHVHARLDGYEHAVRRVAGASLAEHLVFELREAVTVRGVLRDAEQRPVPAQVVRAWSLGDEELSVPVDARTDEDGRFELQHVAIGPQRLVAFVPGSGFTTVKRTVTDDCEVALEPTGPAARDGVALQVDGIAAQDLAEARLRCSIRFRKRELSLPPPHQTVPLAADGSVRLDGVYGGELALRIDAPGYILSPRTRWYTSGQPVFELAFEASARDSQDLAVHGTLRSPAGAALAGVDLVMTASDGSAATFATSGADGAFRFQSSLPRGEPCVIRSLDGRYLLEPVLAAPARHPRMLQCRTWVKPDEALAITAAETATIQGQVRRPDGRPAAGLRVRIEEQMPEARGGWFEVASATTGRDGRYRSDRIHPKAQALRLVVVDPLGCGTGEPFALGGAQGDMGSHDLELQTPFFVEGTLRTQDGKPHVAERVYLARPGPFGQSRLVYDSRRLTDRRGRFRFWIPAEDGDALRIWTRGAKSETFESVAGETLVLDLVRAP